jgi:glycosyltransferase involved in cell wall biosynthesis
MISLRSLDGQGAAAGARGEVRLAVVGISVRSTCGVRDHASLLAGALEAEGMSCSLHWLSREHLDLRGARAELRAWSGRLATELEQRRPDAVLLHYSPFAYSHRGLPVFVHTVLSSVAAAGAPTLTIAHELAYPWGLGGWRGRLWAASQRACVLELMRASAAVVATTDYEQRWLASRAWLPTRPTLVAPVFSNLPPPSAGSRRSHAGRVMGLFGYAYEGAAVPLVLDALALLRRRGMELRLVLLGAPGRSSPTAQQWLLVARERGVEDLLSFVGPLPAQELSDELAACDVLVSCPRSGPTSRKGTLAGSLASGTPVVAIDGPRTWTELLRARAAEVVQPSPEALADSLQALLSDEQRRLALGARGRSFAESHMGLARTAAAVTSLLDNLLNGAGGVNGAQSPRASRRASPIS